MKNNDYAAGSGAFKVWAGLTLPDDLAIGEVLEGDLAGTAHGRVGLSLAARRALAEAVSEGMGQFGLTNRKLAAIAGVDVSLISRIRNGQENPKLETMLKIALALDFTLEEIFARMNKPHNPPEPNNP